MYNSTSPNAAIEYAQQKMQAAQSAGIGAGYGPASDVAAPRETLTSRVAQASEVILNSVETIERRLREMRARLVGPVPEPAGVQTSKQSGFNGIVGTIDQRMTGAHDATQRIHALLDELEKIA